MIWIGIASVALVVFILVIIYSSLNMAKRADKEFGSLDFAMETSEELTEMEVSHEEIKK